MSADASNAASTPHPAGSIEAAWQPPAPPQPVAAWPIPWLLAPLVAPLVILLPRTLGPYAAASNWRAAFLTHWFWLALGFGWWWEMLFLGGPDQAAFGWPWEMVRRGFAATGLLAYMAWTDWVTISGTLVFLGIFEASVIGGSLLLWPFYMVGERTLPLAGRCLKLLLWSTPALSVLVIVMRGLLSNQYAEWLETWWATVMLTWGVWYIWVLLRMGARYVGKPEGPRWAAFEPRCEDCSYNLTGLPLDGRCPECGRPLAESLPSHRQPPAFAQHRGWRQIPGFFQTAWAVCSDKRFSKNLSVWRERRAAEGFAALVCVLIGLIGAGVSTWFVLETGSGLLVGFVGEFFWADPLAFGLVCGLLAFALTALVRALHALAMRGNAAAYQNLLCYQSVWLLVLGIPATGLMLGLLEIMDWVSAAFRRRFRIALDMDLATVMVTLGAGATILLVLAVELWRQSRALRHPNG